MTTGANPAPNL